MNNSRFIAAARRRKFAAFVLTVVFSGIVAYGIMMNSNSEEDWSEYLPQTVQDWIQSDETPKSTKPKA